MSTRVCEFSEPDHPAEYVLIDMGDEDALERPSCAKHLGGTIEWRFVNHAEGVYVQPIAHHATPQAGGER